MDKASTSSDWSRSIFLIGAATFFVVGGLGYISGSAPEWILVKGSIGFVSVGLIGWTITQVIGGVDVNVENEPKVGSNLDVTLPEASPAGAPTRPVDGDGQG